MVVINICQCVFPDGYVLKAPKDPIIKEKEAAVNEEETVALLQEEGQVVMQETGAIKLQAAEKKAVPETVDIMKVCNRSLDVFKGVLVIFMTWAHVNLTLMMPALQYYSPVPHAVGNMASGLCFLGFMTAYGFSCDNAYISDWKERTLAQRLERVARSALLPVVGAWTCGLGWGYMCWKLPFDWNGLIAVLDFRMSLGNGPDFLLCFTITLLCMYPLRHYVNAGLGAEEKWKCAATAAAMLLIPLATTWLKINDCMGVRKYIGYALECTNREAYAPVLPGIPHLFYFNLGLLLSRAAKHVSARVKNGEPIDMKWCAFAGLGLAVVLLIMSYPLFTVWDMNYGNLMAMTKWGPVIRGFVDGPSILWLVGNLFWIYIFMILSVAAHLLGKYGPPVAMTPLRLVLAELEHLGANVLLYLVVGDLLLAGMWRGMMNQYPLDVHGCVYMTIGLWLVTRFLHYLGASGRATGGDVVTAG